MPNKTKNSATLDKLSKVSQQAGLMLMSAAVTLGMLELPDHAGSKVVVPNQPAFEFVENTTESNPNNAIRREREETAPHYVSYSVTQRTPSRTGRH